MSAGLAAAGFAPCSRVFFPKIPSELDRIDTGALPPGPFVPGTIGGAVVRSTEWYREFIARLAAERPRLQIAKMVRVGWLLRHGYLATERRCSRVAITPLKKTLFVGLGNREFTPLS
jgi:hypothetical protein